MFSYYGSKSKIVKCYPPPKFDKIIEPFAGSARYSLEHFDNDVRLYDINIDIINIWKYLQNASKKDILKLPNTKQGDDLRLFNLSKEETMLIYIESTGGGAGNGMGYKITAKENTGFNMWNKSKIRIADNLFKIKHWVINNSCYEDIENEICTWFIDPPYQHGGHKYTFSNKTIDFIKLSQWCKERNGQSIVCENTKANWMPFKPMKDMQGIKFKTTEAIWSNMKTNYDSIQTKMF